MEAEPTVRPRAADPAGRLSWLIISVTLVVTVLMTVAVLAPEFLGENSRMRSIFLAFVTPYQELMAANSGREGELEYVVFVTGEESDYAQRLAPEPGIRFLREGTVPGTIVVSLRVPINEPLNRLRKHPFAGLVVRNNGLFFCH